MKIAPKETGFQKKTLLYLPLAEDVELYKLDKTNSVTWELSTRPGTANAATYKYQVRILQGDEEPRQMVRWRQDVAKVVAGLNVNTVATVQPVHEACMRVGPLASYHAGIQAFAAIRYNTALEAALAEDQRNGNNLAATIVRGHGVDHYIDVGCLVSAIGLTIQDLLPRKILAKVKRNMRRDMRKPKDMKVRNYYQNLMRMNTEELPNLPPFHANQSITNDKMTDIILFGTPKSWQNEMDRQGFNPMDKALHEVVDFMENIETVEEPEKPKSNPNKDSKKKNSSSSNNKKKPTHFCTEHGPNYTHDTKDCKVLANKHSGGSNEKKPYRNKTWTRKADEATGFTKKEVAALIQKEVKKHVKSSKKDLNAASKKRAADDISSDEEDDEKECFLLETLTKDIDGFNYDKMDSMDEKMDDLKIEDDASEATC